MEYAAEDINYGYMSILMHINSEYTLIDKIENIKEIDGTIEHLFCCFSVSVWI